MSAKDDGDRFVPTDPQEYLSLVEALEAMRGETIDKETHVLVMYSIAQAIAAFEHEYAEDETIAESYAEWFLHRIHTFVEHSLRELSVQNPDALRSEVDLLRQSTAKWQEYFSHPQ